MKMMDSDSKNKGEAKEAERKMLDAIHSGEAKMRPRWHFILQAVLLVTGGILALLVVLYLASFILFVLRETGLLFAPTFGAAGWFSFFRSFPWILIFLLLVFVVILAVLVKRYAFVYERPSLYLFVGIVLIVALGGFLIAETPLHRSLFDSARHGNLPVLGGLYQGFGMQRFGDIHRGTIVQTTTNGFIIEDNGGQTSSVVVIPPMQFPPNGGPGPAMGSDVVIFGDRTPSGTINAQGIQPVAP